MVTAVAIIITVNNMKSIVPIIGQEFFDTFVVVVIVLFVRFSVVVKLELVVNSVV
jgi:hypothetical protein